MLLSLKLIDSVKRLTAIARLALAGINPAPTQLVVNGAQGRALRPPVMGNSTHKSLRLGQSILY